MAATRKLSKPPKRGAKRVDSEPKESISPVTESLKRELAGERKRLRALLAEHQTAQEGMQAADEKLRIINEELETASEEVRSSNDQLSKLNTELQQRNSELKLLANDLNNLLEGVDIPVLVLDGDLRIRRFTTVAGSLLNLMPGDVGRPFSDIASPLSNIDWEELFSAVRDSGRLVEREVRDRNGRNYSLRLRPYKTAANEIDGVLVVLLGIDEMKRALERAREARDLAQYAERLNDSILNSMGANVAVLNVDGLIVKTNDAWNRFALENGDPPLTIVGPSANYLEVCRRAAARGDARAQQALDGIRAVLDGIADSFRMEYPCHSAAEQRWFVMNVTPLTGTRGGAVITHTDISDRKLAEVAAQTSESMIRALLASAPQSVIAVDDDKRIVFVNGNVDKMFGYTQEDLLGQPLDILIPEGARARHEEHHRIYFANMQTRPMGIGLELEARRKDGTHFPVEIGLGAIKTEAGKLAVAFVSDITERRRMEEAAQAHAREIHALAASLLTAQEEERRRVSRELHDQICQQLASLAIDMGSLAVEAPLPPELQERVKTLQGRIVKASEETRHIAYELHPSVLDDLGLVASLQDLSKEFLKLTGTAVQFTHDASPASIPREIASCLYRVAREALQNIVQHAKPKQVSLRLAIRKGGIVLTITDDGVGFDQQAVKGRGGLGLIGMEERARLVNGKLSIRTQPGRGTRIALEIPCSAV